MYEDELEFWLRGSSKASIGPKLMFSLVICNLSHPFVYGVSKLDRKWNFLKKFIELNFGPVYTEKSSGYKVQFSTIREKISTTYAIVPFFFQPFNENFKFLKKCPYDFYKM